ncbi:nitroreductase [Colletotrichum musicola]|uniref:Nitroreductase n=1 Tax=Colletotrichum musicola TaxID=2175873 RepID=A0A8H6NM90_9PEZI|nr:nitroreductase [Colletotrichum musicola]
MRQLETLLAQRYGGNGPTYLDLPSTPVIETILRHRSIRSFSPDPLQFGTLEALIAAAQSASTSSMMQTWSAVAIQDPGHKHALAALAGDQDFIRQAPLLLVFCADLSRLAAVCERHRGSGAGLEKTDLFVMAAVDAALAAQSVGTAAESLGLGFCFVGAVRNDSRGMVELLGLPPRVFPFVGMAIGWPDASEGADIKPRLPMDEVLHRERWDGAKDHQALVSSYDEALNKFYEGHGKPGREPWSKHMAGIASSEKQDGRERTRQVLEERGFGLK